MRLASKFTLNKEEYGKGTALIIASNSVKDANQADFIFNTSYHSASLLIENNRLFGPNFNVVVDAVDVL